MNPSLPAAKVVALIEQVRATRPGRASDLGFLQEVFHDEGLVVSACDLASLTYLTWYGSAAESGVSFREHLRKLQADPACTLDKTLKTQIDALRTKRVKVAEEPRPVSRALIGAAGFGAVTALGAFIILRRYRLEIKRLESRSKLRSGKKGSSSRSKERSAGGEPRPEDSPTLAG